MSPLQYFTQRGARRHAREYAAKHASLDSFWAACPRADWLLWLLAQHSPLDRITAVRLGRLFAGRALPGLPASEARPRLLLEAVGRWLAQPTPDHLADVRAARDACLAAIADLGITHAADAARSAACVASAVLSASPAGASRALYTAAAEACHAACGAGSRASEERRVQADLLRSHVAVIFSR